MADPATDGMFYDVIVIGAGISGIGCASRLSTETSRSFVVLERRHTLGGTWDLFKYPGIRSDSDIFTLAYPWAPWDGDQVIVDGREIVDYLDRVAKQFGVHERISYNQYVHKIEWSSEEGRYTVTTEKGTYYCKYVMMGTGYYDYDSPHDPDFDDMESFEGDIIHPQFWPEDCDYTDKEVAVIGSGATAITLVPAMSEKAKSVTMLQRTPTYVGVRNHHLPWTVRKLAACSPSIRGVIAFIVRWIFILYLMFVYHLSRACPWIVKTFLRFQVARHSPENVENFTAPYNPWDQRICAVPDGDIFDALSKNVSIVNGHIRKFLPEGIQLKTGEVVKCDLIVKATGLKMMFGGHVKVVVDGKEIIPGQKLAYKAIMLDGVPNMFFFIGYTNASWTMKIGLTIDYTLRLMAEIDKRKSKKATPMLPDSVRETSLFDLKCGYVQRAKGKVPGQGDARPWRVYQNYFQDVFEYKISPLNNSCLKFE